MEEEKNELKSTLRATVLSSRTQMDIVTLRQDYRKLVGKPLAVSKYGYPNALTFLQEECSDSYLFQGPKNNPVLTLIVPDNLKHLVRGQKLLPVPIRQPNWWNLPETSATRHSNARYVKNKNVIDKRSSENKFSSGPSPSRFVIPKKLTKEELVNEYKKLSSDVKELILQSPTPLPASSLMKLYRETHNRELEFIRFGYMSLATFVYTLKDVYVTDSPSEGWVFSATPYVPPEPRHSPPHERSYGSEDALPGVDYAPEVFPEDCMPLNGSLPQLPVPDIEPGTMFKVLFAEVNSPSDFWLLRIGPDYNLALAELLNDMLEYYDHGEGRQRWLTPGAARVGHYCCGPFRSTWWHRMVVLRVIDYEEVMVLHVDYGTVETVRRNTLKPLLREWAVLPAQAMHARLAGVRPAGAAQCWSEDATAQLLRLVRKQWFVADVVAVNRAERVLEVLLVHTERDGIFLLGDMLVHAGLAEARRDSEFAEAGTAQALVPVAETYTQTRPRIAIYCKNALRRRLGLMKRRKP